MPLTTLERNKVLNTFQAPTTVTSGASSATQTVGSTTGYVAGDILYFGTTAAYRAIQSITNATTVVLTATISTTTSETVTRFPQFAAASMYVGLFTVQPTLAGGGTEVSGNAYARQALTVAAAASGSIASNAAITFPQPTPSSWGTITGFGVFDALTSGNLLQFDTLKQTITSESVTMALGLVQLANTDVFNVVVKNSGDSTTYVEGTDYYVQYDLGVICRIAAGAITASQVLHVTYDCPVTKSIGTTDQLQLTSGTLKIAFESYL